MAKIVCGKIHLDYTNPREWGTLEWAIEGNAYGNTEAQIRFRDCHGRPISLDFNVCRFRHVQKRLEKLDNIIKELEKFRAEYIIALKKTKFTK